jgi:hypothetical protein
MSEYLNRSQGLQELISVIKKDTPRNQVRRAQLLQMPHIIEDLAKAKRELRVKLNTELESDSQRREVLQNPIWITAEKVTEDYTEEVQMTVRDLLVEKYHFELLSINRFNRFNRDQNKLLVKMYFEQVGDALGSYSVEAVGGAFERKIYDKRTGLRRSRLDLILEDRAEDVTESFPPLGDAT